MDKKTVELKKSVKGVRLNEKLSKHTAIGIGGAAKWYVEVKSRAEFVKALETGAGLGMKMLVLGHATNVVPTDKDMQVFVIKNCGGDCKVEGTRIACDSGVRLGELVDIANTAGLAGFEAMAGMPGTVGGAVYGNAAAFGQAISDSIVSVDVWDGKKVKTLSKTECKFAYRDSVFKKKPWVVLGATFECAPGASGTLVKSSADTIALRHSRYDTKMKAPGSFFKNVEAKKFSKKVLASLDQEKIKGGRVPAGYLLDEIGSRGMTMGGAAVASFHGNWIYNKKRATTKDVKALAVKLKKLVKKRFGVELEEEVQYIG